VAVSIITGDLDQSLIDQKEMINEYKAVELKVKLRIKENMGHWFPEDLSNRLDESIVFVTDGR
jgi:ATP-dependent Clp protease ATP-binding subunit ClpA